MKNSLAPARMACRIKSGSALIATAKMPAPGVPVRSRSTVGMADAASPRISTMMRSGGTRRAPAGLRQRLPAQRLSAATVHLLAEAFILDDDQPDELRHGPASRRVVGPAINRTRKSRTCAVNTSLLVLLLRDLGVVGRLGTLQFCGRFVDHLLLLAIA